MRVERHDIEWDCDTYGGGSSHMAPAKDGDWVTYADYTELESRHTSLKADYYRAKNRIAELEESLANAIRNDC